ncbi:protein patched homolog 1-like [Liolophura sinensis]|uniref:protein patched homolog 1-like n=1 Tax=Liolophura sinensis TaxID=3198878 RepID=UPI00315978C6
MALGSRRTLGTVPDEDLLTRTSWVNAEIAYKQVKKGKEKGNIYALWVRSHLQTYLFSIGCFIQLHCGKVLFVGLLLLSLCCVGLKTAKIETNVDELWVEEGGRLEKELEYTRNTIGEGSGTTSEIVIQTPQSSNTILTTESLLLHLQAVLEATKIQVEINEVTWKFKDICYAASLPMFDIEVMSNIIDRMIPCTIITPLDCFWEGAKVLGPEAPAVLPAFGFSSLKWTNLNPQKILKTMKNWFSFELDSIGEIFEKAGITTGYQEKPCLNPADPECPDTAPNKKSGNPPNIGEQLTNGCQGFATKYMNWPEELIVAGVRKSRNGQIIKAEALQSVVLLMGEKDFFEYYQEDYKVHNLDWTQNSAKEILQTWQRKFTEKINQVTNITSSDQVRAFSTMSLVDLLGEFSSVSVVRVALGYVLMVVYACVSLLRWNDAVNSQSTVGILGVLLVALSVAAGLGMCSALGISFNASTTQIIPFLALGLGVDDMFLIAHTYSENFRSSNIPHMDQTGECLKRTGVSVLLTSLSNMLAFFTAAIIPIPALRAFSLQAGILVLFNMGSVLLVFPALVSIDLKRREARRVDFLCCFSGSTTTKVIDLQPQEKRHIRAHVPPSGGQSREGTPPRGYSPPPSYSPPPTYSSSVHETISQSDVEGGPVVTTLAPAGTAYFTRNPSLPSVCPSTTSSQQCLAPAESVTCGQRCLQVQKECASWSLTGLATNYYAPFLQKTYVKVFGIIFFLILLGTGIWGTAQVKDGLVLTDIVPRDTMEYQFIEARSKYFGFYNIHLVTQADFDYPNNQKLLMEYHQAFEKVSRIIKEDDGTLPSFWLSMFKQWLLDIQEHFDADFKAGTITKDEWYGNASDEGILAYKLLLQTGDTDNPVNAEQVTTARLVDADGIIPPKVFYNYLSAWVSNDVMAYQASAASIHPLPKPWYHEPRDIHDNKIPKSQPITYAQIAFYLSNLSDTEAVIDTIKEIREICDTFTEKGLPNYPSGIPFTFWEQYLHLRFYLLMALLCILGVTFVVICFCLMNPWAAAVVVFVLSMMVVELFGVMGIIGVRLSAVPAVILIVAVGIGVEFTVHICVSFMTSIGSRNRRMSMSLTHTFSPVVHGAISTFLGIIMLVGSEFDFIVKYFFNVLTALVILGLLNGLLLLPILLSILGPQGEVRPKIDEERIAPPTPEPIPRAVDRPSRSTSRRVYPRIPSNISLTTITEEHSSQYSSHEIIVQPEVVVETTTVPGGVQYESRSSSRNSTPPGSVPSTPPPGPKHVTRVKATATVKVEVHTPLPGSSCAFSEPEISRTRSNSKEKEQSYKSKRRKLKEIDNSDSDSGSGSSSQC